MKVYNMKNVSVIIPIFNRKQFIDSAIKLLKAQTLKNIEFIIIDDGSNDGSYEYFIKKTKKDERFKIFKLAKNSGPSVARNLALTKSNGKYIGFFDIDDNIPKDYFEKLYKYATNNKSDIVFGTYNNIKHKKTGIINELDKKIESLYNGALWDKLFKKDLIIKNNILFPNGLYCADTVFVFKTFYYAKSIFVCNDIIYSYTLSPDSITFDKNKTTKRKHDIIEILNLILDFMGKNNYDEKAREEAYYFLNRTFNSYNQDRKFIKLRDSILLKIQPKGVYSYKQSRIKVKKNMMIWLKIKKLLGLISHDRFDELATIHKVEKSGLFDKKWYLRTYPDVKAAKVNPVQHYLKYGWREGRNPSSKFDTNAYLAYSPDVESTNMCPLLHYINHGYKEGRIVKSVSGKNILPRHGLKEKIKQAFEYPIRVHDEYNRLKDEIRNLKNSK